MLKPLWLLLALPLSLCGALSPVAAATEAAAADAAAGSEDAQLQVQPLDVAVTSAADTAADTAAAAPSAQGELQEITVTATRTAQSILQVPVSVTALTEGNLAQLNVQDFQDYAKLIPNLSFAHSGFGAVTDTEVIIRGIQGTDTTAFYIDDVPVPVNIDPRVLDIQRLEVLRGPQGTLFGESSMGGAIRMITNQPDTHNFDGNYMLQAGYTTGAATPNAGGNVILNIPLVADTLAIRFAAYIERDGGWLTRSYLNQPFNPANAGFPLAPLTFPYVGGTSTIGDQGRQLSGGGSISVRWDVTHDFNATARILAQSEHQDGYPIQWGLLASGTTSFLSNPELFELPAHEFNFQDYIDDRWYLPSLNLTYAPRGFSVISSTSYFERYTVATEADPEGEDQVEYLFNGPAEYAALPLQNHVWDDQNKRRQFTEEDRFSLDPIKFGFLQFSGLIGYYWSRQWTGPPGLMVYSVNQAGTPFFGGTYGLAASGAWPNNIDWLNTPSVNYNTDSSWFGELNFKLFDRVTLSIGDRYYHLSQYNAGAQGAYGWSYGTVTPAPAEPNETENVGHSPRYSVTYEFNPDASAYASVARGFRVGYARAPNQSLPAICNADLEALGISPATAGNVSPDSLWDYEVGTKFQLHHPEMVFSGDIYDMDWTKMQQTFDLACNYSVTANAGEAKSSGAEVEATVNPLRPLSIHADAGLENAHIVQPGPGQYVGEGLFLVPRWTASGGFIYTTENTFDFPFTKANGHLFYQATYSYTDSSLSNNTSARFVVTLGQYHVLTARVGMQFEHSTLALNGSNLTNGRDNLGDYLTPGWAFDTTTLLGSRTAVPTFFVSQPRTLMLQYQAQLFAH